MPEALIDSTRSIADLAGELNLSGGEPFFSPVPATSSAASVYVQTNLFVDNAFSFQVLKATPHSKPDSSKVDELGSARLPRLWERAANQFRDRILQDLDDDCSDADTSDPVTLGYQARTACLGLASALAATMAFQPGLKYAAFVEEEGGVSLVVQSRLSARRANFRISPDGSRITVVSVNEIGRTEATLVHLQEIAKLQRWVEWVSKQE